MDSENNPTDVEIPAPLAPSTTPAPTEPLVHCSMFPARDENGSLRNTLNDDCTVQIYERMQTHDLILASCFCEHCLDLIKCRIFPYRTINSDDIFKKYNMREVFAQFGSKISDLIIHWHHIQDKSTTTKTKSDSQQLLEMLTLNCASLEKLDISLNFHDIDIPCIESFANELHNIQALAITSSRHYSTQRSADPSENNHKLEILLQKAEKMKTIQIKMMSIGGEFLHRTPIKHLTELALVQCDHIQVDALVESAAHMKCLTQFVWQNSKFDGIQCVSENIATVCDIVGREFETVQSVAIHMNYGLKYCTADGERSVLLGLKQLPHLKSLSIGLAGACACNDFYGVIQQFVQLKSLAIESPLVFGGRINCLPCGTIIANYLPKIFAKLPNLTHLRVVRMNSNHQSADYMINAIMDKLQQIDELHLIGIRQFNGEHLLSLVRNIPKLKLLSLDETRFNFTLELYMDLVNECQTRHLKIIVNPNVRRTILARVAKHYRKEFVQIITVD